MFAEVLLQLPPAIASVAVITAPAHTAAGPLIAVGVVFTVIDFADEQPVAATV